MGENQTKDALPALIERVRTIAAERRFPNDADIEWAKELSLPNDAALALTIEDKLKASPLAIASAYILPAAKHGPSTMDDSAKLAFAGQFARKAGFDHKARLLLGDALRATNVKPPDLAEGMFTPQDYWQFFDVFSKIAMSMQVSAGERSSKSEVGFLYWEPLSSRILWANVLYLHDLTEVWIWDSAGSRFFPVQDGHSQPIVTLVWESVGQTPMLSSLAERIFQREYGLWRNYLLDMEQGLPVDLFHDHPAYRTDPHLVRDPSAWFRVKLNDITLPQAFEVACASMELDTVELLMAAGIRDRIAARGSSETVIAGLQEQIREITGAFRESLARRQHEGLLPEELISYPTHDVGGVRLTPSSHHRDSQVDAGRQRIPRESQTGLEPQFLKPCVYRRPHYFGPRETFAASGAVGFGLLRQGLA